MGPQRSSHHGDQKSETECPLGFFLFSPFISFRPPAYGMVPKTFRVDLFP
jgi:hypothetical protein